MTIEVREVEQPEHFQHMPPAPYELARCWPMRHKVAVSLACYAITERYRVGPMFDVPKAGDDKVYLHVGEKLLMAQLTNRDPSSFCSDAVAILCVDSALSRRQRQAQSPERACVAGCGTGNRGFGGAAACTGGALQRCPAPGP